MLKFVLRKLINLLEENSDFLIEENEKELLKKAQMELKNYKHINFYSINAETLIKNKINQVQVYIKELNKLADRLKKSPIVNTDIDKLISKISNVLAIFEKKQNHLLKLQSKIPEGMLDVKRALYISMDSSLSKSPQEETNLKKHFTDLKLFMSRLNEQYSTVIQQGGSLDTLLLNATTFYWTKLFGYTKLLKQNLFCLENSNQLTPAGHLALRCLKSALPKAPSQGEIDKALSLLKKVGKSEMSTQSTMKEIGFCSKNSREACLYLSQLGKLFFHMPHNENMYHFDYDPTDDLADTLGNCFGESMLFIHSLSKGTFKRICPEFGLINFQLDQSLTLKFQKQTLGQAETNVSAQSKYQSLQWEDTRNLFLNNLRFNPGDLCGITLTMNDYTKSKKSILSGHIAVVAKLDTRLSPYKYLVFEKELGALGLVDDESLEYVISQQVLPIYESSNYSQIKLIKYGEATKATYDLLTNIKPIIGSSKRLAVEKEVLEEPFTFTFFSPGPVVSKPEESKAPTPY